MTMVFQRVQTQGIAQLSYLIGDDASGTAAVIDPRPNVDIYLDLARQYGAAITHVFETHIHADFMSGARELVSRTGSAMLCASGEGGAEYGFEVSKVHDGDRFGFGSVTLTARHTPGHTPEHVSFEIAEKQKPDNPWDHFTDDSLFVGSAGRPDLLGDEQTDELVEKLFRTLRDYYLNLPDGVIIYPCHGAGSACGADIGDRPMGTIGYEREPNDFLQYEEFQEFKEFVEENAPPEPHHYKHLKMVNADGPPVLGHAPPVPGLPLQKLPQMSVHELKEHLTEVQLLDVRAPDEWEGGHIPGARHLYVADMRDGANGTPNFQKDRPVVSYCDSGYRADIAASLLQRRGYTDVRNVPGSWQAWKNAGYQVEK